MLTAIKKIKRLIVSIFGFTILIIGLAMLILPGPGLIIIPIGLAVLATEYLWARNLLNKVKKRFKKERIVN
jgi:uncharacterized protein (TIGR02611 family)